MKVTFDPHLKAYVTTDDEEHVKYINYTQEYWTSDEKAPILAAVAYVNHVAEVLQISREYLSNIHQRVSYLDPREQGIQYRLSEEKRLFDSVTLGFYQTYLDVPVWQAGLTVTLKERPYRIVGVVNTSQEGLDARLPHPDKIRRFKELFAKAAADNQFRGFELGDKEEEPETAKFLHGLVDRAKLRDSKSKGGKRNDNMEGPRIIRGRFYVYKYDEKKRLPVSEDKSTRAKTTPEQTDAGFPGEHEPILPLPPVHRSIKDGQYYVVAEIIFSFPIRNESLNWLALVEIDTGSVLLLKAMVASVNGYVFKQDPITSSGLSSKDPDKDNTTLNPFRASVVLPNLNAPVAGVQSLKGSYANLLINCHDPNIAPPTKPSGSNFDTYSVRTNEFAAVNAYYHVDRFFALVQSLGFPISTYFNNTTFPIRVDHRGCRPDPDPKRTSCPGGIDINAHCMGGSGISHCCYMLNAAAIASLTTLDPIGIALDWRVHLHELGGHGVLYEHVSWANFGFAHSAGDSIAMIVCDPESKAPDRFILAPWVPLVGRRADRDVTTGWAWGGANDVPFTVSDPGGYMAEQILATTLFRIYRSIGGDHTNLGRRTFASRMMTYLILSAIHTLTPATNPSNSQGFCNALIYADTFNWTTEGVYGGAYNKVIRWSFEKQGLYQAPGATTPVTTAGQPPAVDVYIDDGRGGEYPYQAIHWQNISIWNQRSAIPIAGHETPASDVPNYAYVKIKNRGTQQANNVKVRGYHSKPKAGLIWPNDFQPLTTPELPGGTLAPSGEKIVGPFEWTPIINGYGHDCMLMIVTADDDLSNADTFTVGEFLNEWRLVPNDNNVGQRNLNPVPGGGGKKGLLEGLDGYSFWVGNANLNTSTMELAMQLPDFLASNGWSLSFKDIIDNRFELRSGKEREVFMELHAGNDFDKHEVQNSKNKDINVYVSADGILLGGMTYRLDPDLKEPYNKRTKPSCDKTKCVNKAQELLDCLGFPTINAKDIRIKNVVLDVEVDNCCNQ
jgi:hypothetical protein